MSGKAILLGRAREGTKSAQATKGVSLVSLLCDF